MTSTTTTDTSITIRLATDEDMLALRRLAQLDGARLPEGELLLAEADGEIRAALRSPTAPTSPTRSSRRASSSACSTSARSASAARSSRAPSAPARGSRCGARLYQRAAETRLML